MDVDVLVLGAGISGLSAAYHFKKGGFNVWVVEKQKTVGGRAQSTYLDDVSIDTGALFFTNSYKHTFKLLKALGIYDQVVPIKSWNGIVAKDQIFTLPPHSYLDLVKLIPFSSWIKLSKVMIDVLHHNNMLNLDDILKSFPLDTESVADFANRRLDSVLLNFVIDPILQGIWYWDSKTTTNVALYLLLKQALTMRLFALKSGMGVLANTLAQDLDIGVETQAIQSKYDPVSQNWKTVIRNGDGERIVESRAVLCTLPAIFINGIFVELPDSIKKFFSGIKYTSVTTTHLLLNEKTNTPQYYGLFYPAVEAKAIATVAIQSNKISSQMLKNRSAISLYSTNEFSQKFSDQPDDEIRRIMVSKAEATYPFLRQELSRSTVYSKIIRSEPALPVFNVGYICDLRKFHSSLVNDLPPGLFFAGDFIGGPHIEGAIISTENILPDIKNFLQNMGR